ncbi:SirB2 family protein [Gallaecimonas kandeliae]|uniref:SirB2 family protein n=1 Tax=Gallaecimonas kandeliae TaxID=3029055 RepID=UPI002647F673|nr:SirB2 family protein [Gallaecimonas kandeliae]WKE65411.1 SirB2 family protein [Gallaecimonas kandeliae]
MTYSLVKAIHQALALVTILFFVWRASRAVLNPASLPRWARIAPHVIDTLLLAAGLWLMLLIHQYPFKDGWLTAKLLGLLLYIGLGTIAIKRGRSTRGRALAALGAVLVFIYIVGVAIYKTPWSWL